MKELLEECQGADQFSEVVRRGRSSACNTDKTQQHKTAKEKQVQATNNCVNPAHDATSRSSRTVALRLVRLEDTNNAQDQGGQTERPPADNEVADQADNAQHHGGLGSLFSPASCSGVF